VRNLRKIQKIILVIGLIIVFYCLIHPENGTWNSTGGYYTNIWNNWIWDASYSGYGRSIIYRVMLIKMLIVSVGTVIALLIESLFFSKKKDA